MFGWLFVWLDVWLGSLVVVWLVLGYFVGCLVGYFGGSLVGSNIKNKTLLRAVQCSIGYFHFCEPFVKFAPVVQFLECGIKSSFKFKGFQCI